MSHDHDPAGSQVGSGLQPPVLIAAPSMLPLVPKSGRLILHPESCSFVATFVMPSFDTARSTTLQNSCAWEVVASGALPGANSIEHPAPSPLLGAMATRSLLMI